MALISASVPVSNFILIFFNGKRLLVTVEFGVKTTKLSGNAKHDPTTSFGITAILIVVPVPSMIVPSALVSLFITSTMLTSCDVAVTFVISPRSLNTRFSWLSIGGRAYGLSRGFMTV